jgi:hypothetical protein
MKKKRLLDFGVSFLVLSSWVGGLPVVLAGDTQPPELLSLSFTPTVIDVSDSPRQIQFEVVAEDDLSGINSISIVFQSPALGHHLSVYFSRWDLSQLQGNVATYSRFVQLSQYAESGLWQVEYISLSDNAGNNIWLDGINARTYLQSRGLPYEFEVTGIMDSQPPELLSLSFTPTVIDVSDSPRQIQFEVRAEDDLSGIDWISINFRSPALGHYLSVYFSSWELSQLQGNVATYSRFAQLPQYAESGLWQVENITLSDNAGNSFRLNGVNARTYLQSRGLPYEFEVTGIMDSQPPELLSLSFMPTVIDVSNRSRLIQIEVVAEDDLSGVSSVSLEFRSPSMNQQLWVDISEWDFVWSLNNEIYGVSDGRLPRYSESGLWIIENISIRDKVGNSIWLDGQDARDYLISRDLPYSFVVASNVQINSVRMLSNGHKELVWDSSPSVSYNLQQADALYPQVWSTISGPHTANSNTMSVLSPVSTNATPSFYRIQVLSP